MEKDMNTNKITIIGTIIAIILIISIPTIYKVVKDHNEHLYLVVEEKIIEGAKKCFYDNVCTNNEITLKELYDNKYLSQISDPVTKEYYNEKSYVKRNDKSFQFVRVE